MFKTMNLVRPLDIARWDGLLEAYPLMAKAIAYFECGARLMAVTHVGQESWRVDIGWYTLHDGYRGWMQTCEIAGVRSYEAAAEAARRHLIGLEPKEGRIVVPVHTSWTREVANQH